uniref:CSON004700 protein n=1 Tax=Culicoides sonorensis TaxID=179676 RepID=A0A336LXQ0_CULSO
MGKNKGKNNQGDKKPQGGGQQQPQHQGQGDGIPQQQGQQRPPGQQQQGPPGQQQEGQAQTSQSADTRPPKGEWKKKGNQQKGEKDNKPEQGQAQLPQSDENRPPKNNDWKNKGKQKQKPDQQPQGEPKAQPQKEIQQQQPPTRAPSQDSQSSKLSEKSLSGQLQKLEIADIEFPTRDSITKTSRFKKERIQTNYLELNLNKLPDIIYNYDIKFDPERPKKFLFPAFDQLLRNHLPQLLNKAAYDGAKNFFSMIKVNDGQFGPIMVPSPDGGRDKEFKIQIKCSALIDMKVIKNYPNHQSKTSLQTAIQALDIVLRSAFNRSGLIRHKRSVFASPVNRIPLEDNYELYIGLFQSFVMGTRPFLNVDVSHKAFPSAAPRLEPLYNQFSRNFVDVLKNLNLVYTSPMTGERKTFKFNGLKGPANKEMFMDEQDNRKKTIAQYFQEKGHPLQYPGNPCIHVGPPAKNILIPMEFLSIPAGQALNAKAPESCTRGMVRVAAKPTHERKDKIMDLLRNIRYSGVETIKQFGIVVGENFIDVDSHILNPPNLQYGNNKVLRITKPGEWRAENEQFLIPDKCTRWGILVMDNRAFEKDIDNFGNGIAKMARNMGLNFADYDRRNVEYNRERFLKQPALDQIINSFKDDQMELLFVVISEFGDQYQDVKKSAELRCGMLTQCVKSRTIQRINGSTLNNIMLKVNSKLGGTNHVIEAKSNVSIGRQPFMVIGADVTHPSPEQTNIPSVVGVAASYDKNAFRYNCQWRIQNPRDETIRDLQEIVEENLRIFKQKHNILPKHILYYRDGVSEGQFPEIKQIELQAIQRACQTIGGPDNKIKITVIIVQKRHHTRFFPKTPNQFDRKNNNVTPGTVVDSEIVDTKKKWQFFMVSHISIQGTAKPTKYCIIHDDAGVSNEDLQVFTYNLCHLFTRCNRSVSYVAPTYYAHLVAYRGRVYIHNERIDFNNLGNENKKRQIRPEVIIQRPMFFV